MTLVEEKKPITLTADEPIENPSMDQLRTMMANPDAEIEQTKAKEPATGTGEVPKQEAAKETKAQPIEEKLPKGVQKRLDEEHAEQEKYDRIILEAVGKTKAKKHEAETLTGAQGSEPVKTPKPEEKKGNEPPTPPDFLTFTGTAEEFAAALQKYHKDYPEWLKQQTRETVEGEFQRRQESDAAKVRWDNAVKEHGAEFGSLMSKFVADTPESMQEAISQLENWSKVAVHLAKNPTELTALAEKFKVNPIAATAQLGRIEERLSAAPVAPPAPKPKAAVRIPAPLSTVEAPAEEGTGAFDYESATPAQRRAFLVRNGALD